MQNYLLQQSEFLQKECWHIELAQNHILKCANEDLIPYLTSPNTKISGKLVMDSVNQAKLCGLSIRAIEHIFLEIGKACRIDNEYEIMTEFDIARLLQVCVEKVMVQFCSFS